MSNKGKSIYDQWDFAIKERDIAAMSQLLSQYPKLVDQGIIHYRGNGTTFQTLPLNMVNDTLAIAKLLLEHGANPNAYGDGNVLALHNATPEVTRYLIAQGAEVNLIGYEDFSPLMYEVYMENHENVETLIQHGAEVNFQKAHDGYTCLHWAARKGYLAIAKLLLQHGAKLGALNKENQTARDLAIENGHSSVAEYLEEKTKEV